MAETQAKLSFLQVEVLADWVVEPTNTAPMQVIAGKTAIHLRTYLPILIRFWYAIK